MGKKFEAGFGVVADVIGNFRAGGGEKLVIAVFRLHLRKAQRVGPEIDADWMRPGANKFWISPNIFWGAAGKRNSPQLPRNCYRRLLGGR